MALGEELVFVVALPLVLLPVLMLLSLLPLKIQAVTKSADANVDDAFVVVFVVAVDVAVDAVVDVDTVAAAADDVVIVVVADPAPDAATLPPAHRHLPNLPAHVADAPPPSPPRVADPLPLRHPKSGDTCCSSFRSYRILLAPIVQILFRRILPSHTTSSQGA